ncbi:MAG: type I polyketide synthase, partial [Acidimicrobiales bacterium]
MRTNAASNGHDPRSPGVAIVGMACLFPGAPDLDAYWRNILNKVDAVSDVPPEAWDTGVYFDPTFEDADKVYCQRGGYLGSLLSFDPLPHGIPPVSVGGEPDQWIALQIARDALADAGCEDLPADVRRRTGIVLGKGTYLNGGNAIAIQRGLIVGQTIELLRQLHPELGDDDLNSFRAELKQALPSIGPETVPGLIPNIIVGRIANRLDLMGPTYTVDAACASSLVAMQLAIRDLQEGRSDLALAGGSQLWIPVPALNVFCQLNALSRRERIRPFDKDADGTLLGEGIGMVVLKRLADAEADGDRVYAVVRGVGVSSDGRGASVMAPRVEGEELALRRAYEDAGVSPASVGLIEAHGTATPVGDATEVQALSRVFGTRRSTAPRCGIGTVKSMISHTIPAAGVAGVIKLALSLYHKVLPPTLGCDTPNPRLELENTPFYVNTETRPWIHGGTEPRRAGINAFGFGGINAHAVLEEHDGGAARPAPERPVHAPPWDSEVCILESDSAVGLAEQAARLAEALDTLDGDGAGGEPPFTLTDLAFTLSRALHRHAEPLRLGIVATSLPDLRAKLVDAATRLAKPGCRKIKAATGVYFVADPLGRHGKTVFLFPGEGAQYPGMMTDLCLHFPAARAVFDRADRLNAHRADTHLPSDEVFPPPVFTDEDRRRAEQRLMQMDIAVEAVVMAGQALHEVVTSLGVRPDACLGHSSGEYSAAVASGVLDVDSDDRLAALSLSLQGIYAAAASRDDVPKAVLLAVAADREQLEAVAREAGGDVFVAMDNCPHQGVLVGERTAVARARAVADRDGLIYEELAADRAVHTPLFAPYSGQLQEAFAGLVFRPGRTAFYSCTTAAPYPDEPDAIRALLLEHWTRPVEFRRTIEALYDEGARVFVEIGPRGNLVAFTEDILRGREHCAVPSDVRHRSGVTQLNHLVAQLAAHGVAVEPAALFAHRNARDVDWEAAARQPRTTAPGSRINLAWGWPMLRLPAEKVAALRARLEPAGAPA